MLTAQEIVDKLRQIIGDAEAVLSAPGAADPLADTTRTKRYVSRIWFNTEGILKDLNEREID